MSARAHVPSFARAALLVASVVACSGLAGCRSVLGLDTTPIRSYVLAAAAPAADGVVATPDAVVGLLPVVIPGYLDRMPVVTRESDGRLTLASHDLWAEGLDRGIARVLVQDLTRLRADRLFESFPWRRTRQLDAQIALTVERFEGPLGREVDLAARWTVFGPDGKTPAASRRASFREASADASYDALVAAMSRSLSRLAEAIAESLPR